MESEIDPETTALLGRVAAGDETAAEELFPALYEDLRRRARRMMRGQPSGHTLQTTALVHEAWMRLVLAGEIDPRQRSRILGVAAKAMRCLLIDHARARKARKRGGSWSPASLAAEDLPARASEDVMLDVDQALERLGTLDDELRKISELRLFGGLELDEIAEAVGVSKRTVERRWHFARAWLRRELGNSAT